MVHIQKVLLSSLAFLCFNKAVIFKFTNLVCENEAKTWIIIEECRIRAVNREINTMNMNFTLLRPISYCRIEGQIFNKITSLAYHPWLVPTTIDACRFMKHPYNPIALIIFKLFKEFTNLNHTCPYTGSIIFKEFYLRWNKLPHAIPTGDYLLNMSWYLTNTSRILTRSYFSFKEDF